MNYNRFRRIVLPCFALAGALALNSCTDNDYDFNEVDMTVGIGGDGLSLPVSSTAEIKLEDVLELDGSECVKVRENGDYYFEQTGDAVAPVHPNIAPITVSKDGTPQTMSITIHAVAGTPGQPVQVTADGEAVSFSYSGSKPEEVIELERVGVNGSMTFTVNFPRALRRAVSSISRMTVTLPSYMELGSVSTTAAHTVSGNEIVFTNVPTSRNLTVTVNLAGLSFNGGNNATGTIAVNGSRIDMTGNIQVSMSATVDAGASTAGLDGSTITSNLQMPDITINSAYGRFNPQIDLNDLGNTEITGVPDFLTDGDVRVDLYNPQILITISNDMEIGGTINGVITAYKDGAATASIRVEGIEVNPNGTSKICICRRENDIDKSQYTQVIGISNLSDLIMTIPDNIKFDAEATADSETPGNFEFGKQYTIKPVYSVEAPITFDENACIVYKDTLDGWHDDIDDLNLSEDAYISMTATIENRVPAFLNLTVNPIDADGNIMPESDITVEVSTTVLASGDGETPSETPLEVIIRQHSDDALSRLDGLTFKIEASASEEGHDPVTKVTLNAKTHTLVARDINVKLVGKVIGDFN